MEQAEILTRLRKEKGLSQTEAAEELGVTRQAISKWESGRAFPSMEKLIALSRLYGATVEELTGTKEGPEPEGGEAEIEALPEHESMDTPEESVPQKHQANCPNKSVQITAGIVCICFGIGIFLWGRLTNSRALAKNLLIFMALLLIIVWFIFFSYSIYRNRRNNKNE